MGPLIVCSPPFSWLQTLYTNALSALEQLMEGLMKRQLGPRGLQEMVHVSSLVEGLPATCKTGGAEGVAYGKYGM